MGFHGDAQSSADPEELLDGGGDIQLAEGTVEVLVQEFAHGAFQVVGVGLLVVVAESQEELCGVLFVVLQDAEDQAAEEFSFLPGESPAGAEVQIADLVAWQCIEISRVGVCVEESEVEDLLEHQGGHGLGERLGGESCLPEGLWLIQLQTLDEVHGEDVVGAIIFVDPRDHHAGIVLELQGEAADIPAFAVEACLGLQGLPELLHHPRQHEEAEGGVSLVELLRKELQHIQVRLDIPEGAGTQDLHEDRGAILEDRAISLGEGGGRHGLLLEFLEELLRGGAEFLLQDLPDLVLGEGGYAVLQERQLCRAVGPHQIRPGGEHLAQFYIDGPQLLQHLPQPRVEDRRVLGRLVVVPEAPAHQVPGPLEEDAQAVPEDHLQDAAQPGHVGAGAVGGEQWREDSHGPSGGGDGGVPAG